LTYSPTLYWNDVREGDPLPAFRTATSYRQAVMHVGAGRDYMLDHYDSEYVHANGHPTVYFNTLFHQSMVDRTIIGWAGPHCFLVRRKIAMRGPIYAGDEVQGVARVTRVFTDECGRGRVDLSVTLSTPRGVCCDGDASIALPMRP
jgi:acyl dehydratase